MKKIISMILFITLIFGMAAPASASTENVQETYIEIISDNAPLRTGPGKNHEAVASLEKGDCLVMTGWSENRHGNIWYHCQYAGSDETLYIFSDHVKYHTHSYQAVTSEFSYCPCGRFEIDSSSGIALTNGLLLNAGSLLTNAIVAATAELSTMGSAITSGMGAAFPYVAVVSISGMLIYMAVSRSGAQVKDVVRVESFTDVWRIFETEGPNVYYAASFVFGNTPALILTSDGMDLDDATDYMTGIVNNRANAFISNLDNKPMLNIWTPLHDSAAILCETFLVRNRGFVYGNSNKDICVPEHDSIRKTWKIQFDHFHLLRMDNPFSLSKVRDIHVMFGPPLEIHDFI